MQTMAQKLVKRRFIVDMIVENSGDKSENSDKPKECKGHVQVWKERDKHCLRIKGNLDSTNASMLVIQKMNVQKGHSSNNRKAFSTVKR